MYLSAGVWRVTVPNLLRENCWKRLSSFRGAFNSSSLSLITAPSSPHLSVLITANPSPHWTATHLWRPRRITQIQSKHTLLFIPTTCVCFALFPGFCLQWKDLTFTPVFTCLCCCAAARCSPRQFFCIARACYCSEISPRGRRSAGETPRTWNKAALLLHFGTYRCVLDCFNRSAGSFLCFQGTYRWVLW